MTFGHFRGFWRRARGSMRRQGNPSYTDAGMDTPERAAEKKHDAARVPPRYPGDNVPPGAWTSGGPY